MDSSHVSLPPVDLTSRCVEFNDTQLDYGEHETTKQSTLGEHHEILIMEERDSHRCYCIPKIAFRKRFGFAMACLLTFLAIIGVTVLIFYSQCCLFK